MRNAKMSRPRIPWTKVWGEFDAVWRDLEPDWSAQRRVLGEIVDRYVAPWSVDWASVWACLARRISNRTRFQTLIRKYLREPKT